MPKYTTSLLALIIGVSVVILSTIPLALPVGEVSGLGVDKLSHAFAYFCFAISLFLALHLDWKIKASKKWASIGAFSLGFLLEIIQGVLLDYRSFESYDLLANTMGIVLFIFLSKRVKKLLSNAVFL